MSEICLRLKTGDWYTNKIIVSSDRKEADVIVESFASMLATGKIKINFIDTIYPKSELFEDMEERYTDYNWEEEKDSDVVISKVPELKKKSELVVQLEAAAETERTQPNDDLAAAE